MKLCWARVSSHSCQNHSIFHSFSLKDLSSGNDGASNDTEIVRVASLSAIFERRCKFYFFVVPASLLIVLPQFRKISIRKVSVIV